MCTEFVKRVGDTSRSALASASHIAWQLAGSPVDEVKTVAMVAGLALPHAGAANIAMNASNAIGFSGFNSGTGWTGGAAPTGGNNYFTGAFTLRTPADGTSRTFAGGSLSIDTGGRFLFKNTGSTATITVGNLILNGGITDFAVANSDSWSVTLAGSINVNAASILGALGATANNSSSFETLNVTATISGTAGLTIAGTSNSGANTGVVKLSAANSYSGTVTVATPGVFPGVKVSVPSLAMAG